MFYIPCNGKTKNQASLFSDISLTSTGIHVLEALQMHCYIIHAVFNKCCKGAKC